MAQGLRRSGRVVDREGRPVEGALVSVAESEGPVPEIALRTDPDGRFAFPLPPGLTRLRAHAPGGEVGSVVVQEGGEGEGEEILLRVGPPE